MEPNWKPLELKLGAKHCAGFLFTGRANGVNLCRHGIARTHLDLDRELAGVFESVYDESYVERKRKAFTVVWGDLAGVHSMFYTEFGFS